MFDALERQFQKDKYECPNLINELYQGTMKDYVQCLKVRKRSTLGEGEGGRRERERGSGWDKERRRGEWEGGRGEGEGGEGKREGGKGEGERYEWPIHCSSFLILHCYLHAVWLRECS